MGAFERGAPARSRASHRRESRAGEGARGAHPPGIRARSAGAFVARRRGVVTGRGDDDRPARMNLLRQFVTFFGVGVLATITDWGTFFVLGRFFGLPNVYAALIAYCCGGVLSYTLNRMHTFASDRSHFEAGWRFAAVMAVGFTLTGFFVWFFAERLDLPPMVARVLSTGIVFFWNYAAHKLWTFAARTG